MWYEGRVSCPRRGIRGKKEAKRTKIVVKKGDISGRD